MLTQERADILSAILNADEERAQILLGLEASKALEQINALGNDFTLDELKEYGKALQAVAMRNDELNVENLDEVVGGGAFTDFFINLGEGIVAGLKKFFGGFAAGAEAAKTIWFSKS